MPIIMTNEQHLYIYYIIYLFKLVGAKDGGINIYLAPVRIPGAQLVAGARQIKSDMCLPTYWANDIESAAD